MNEEWRESSSSESNEVISVPRKRKRGVRHTEIYKRNVIRKARVEGKSYKNWNGQLVPAKNTPDTINVNCCKKKCLVNVESSLLEDAMQLFYDLETKDQQDLHLQRLMELSPVQRSRPRASTPEDKHKRKQKMVGYHLLIDRQRIAACKSAFLSVYNISKKRVERIANLLEMDIAPIDKRGKTASVNVIDSDTCALIYDHIQSFPIYESHYSSRQTKCLSSNLTVKAMHNLFLQKYLELKGKVKYQFYWDYFRKQFSLTFGRPAQDTCSTCEELKTKLKSQSLNDTAKRMATAELLVHKRRSNKFYKSLEESAQASNGSNILGLCFDFMAVFDLPKIPVQDVYYFRQLSLNNFGIYNMHDNTMTNYIYHEGVAPKSPNDVISFLFHYLQNYVPHTVEEIHLFCDNCAGQNKNHTLIRAVMALVELAIFKHIKVFFPMRGHSYLPCDRNFGLIKRKIKKIDRVYTVDEYVDLVATASDKPEKFRTVLVDSSMIMDFQKWYTTYYFKHTTALETKLLPAKDQTKFLISTYHFFECSSEDPNTIKASEFIGGLVLYNFRLRKGNASSLSLPSNHAEKVSILDSKMNDLRKLRPYIPDEALQSFWNNIYQWTTETASGRSARMRNSH